MIGTRLGPYEITAKLGAGGMGEVWRAIDSRLRRDVAVKLLPTEVAHDQLRLRRFEREARAASSLNHSNLLTVFDVGRHEGRPYLVTELLEGSSLRDVLEKGGPVAPHRLADWGAQVARGLAAAHERGIVHRDIKPENLFVCRDGRVKILDFGLAKLVQPELDSAPLAVATTLSDATLDGVVLGTAGYMSPEQVRGERVDARTDLFALGCVLYELATGRRAFRRDTLPETLTAILNEDPPHLDSSGGAFPPALARIVERLLAKDPALRFQSAGDLAFDLEQHGDPRRSRPAVSPPRATRTQRRALWVLATLAAVAALAAAVWLARGWSAAPEAAETLIESLAVLPLEDLARDPEQAYFVDGMTEALIAELAQISGLRVISRTSVMRFKGTTLPLREIARELDVDGLVGGSIVRSEGRVRITAHLVHGSSDRHLWARSYERDLRDVLTLQSEIAREIAREIRVRLTPEEESRLATARPVDPAAYEAFLKGRFLFSQMAQPGHMERAREQFARAVSIDPSFAAAWAGLADCWRRLEGQGTSRQEAELPARQAASRALELDPGSPEAHTAMGALVIYFDWDIAAGLQHFRTALELAPGYAMARHRLGFTLGLLGRHQDALAEARAALRLDPLESVARVNVMRQLLVLGRVPEARAELESLQELDEALARLWEARVATAEGRLDRAVELVRESGDTAALAGALARAGRRAEALALLPAIEREVRDGGRTREGLALVYAALGRRDDAFAELEAAFAERATFLVNLRIELDWEPLRADPRFDSLLRRIGLVDQPST